eukprot:SAG11_NODE_2701_length_3076_cov_5.049043_4_plen_227_part_00
MARSGPEFIDGGSYTEGRVAADEGGEVAAHCRALGLAKYSPVLQRNGGAVAAMGLRTRSALLRRPASASPLRREEADRAATAFFFFPPLFFLSHASCMSHGRAAGLIAAPGWPMVRWSGGLGVRAPDDGGAAGAVGARDAGPRPPDRCPQEAASVVHSRLRPTPLTEPLFFRGWLPHAYMSLKLDAYAESAGWANTTACVGLCLCVAAANACVDQSNGKANTRVNL